MIALTAGEPPLEVPRTPFALFCSSMKIKKSEKKNMSELQRLKQTTSHYFSSLPLFPFPPHHVLGLYYFPLSIRFFFFDGGEGRGGRHSFHPPKPSCWQRACFVITFCALQPSFCVFLTYALQSCIGAFCLSELAS